MLWRVGKYRFNPGDTREIVQTVWLPSGRTTLSQINSGILHVLKYLAHEAGRIGRLGRCGNQDNFNLVAHSIQTHGGPKKHVRPTCTHLHTTFGSDERIYRYTSHTPLGRFFPSSIARQPRGCQCRTTRLRKALGETFPRSTCFCHRWYSNCRDIDHRNRPRGGLVLYTKSCTVPNIVGMSSICLQ